MDRSREFCAGVFAVSAQFLISRQDDVVGIVLHIN
jgi:hypothetical protein